MTAQVSISQYMLQKALHLDVNLFPVKQPHQEQPEKDVGNGKEERSVDGRGPRSEQIFEDEGLQRDGCAVAAWDFDDSHQAREQS